MKEFKIDDVSGDEELITALFFEEILCDCDDCVSGQDGDRSFSEEEWEEQCGCSDVEAKAGDELESANEILSNVHSKLLDIKGIIKKENWNKNTKKKIPLKDQYTPENWREYVKYQNRIQRFFRKLLLNKCFEVVLTESSRNSRFVEGAIRKNIIETEKMKKLNDYRDVYELFEKNKVRLNSYSNEELLYKDLNDDLVQAVDQNLNSKATPHCGTFLGPTLYKFSSHWKPDSQLYRKVSQSTSNTAVFLPSIGQVQSSKVSSIQTLSSNLIAHRLNQILYKDNVYRETVVDGPAFLMIPPGDAEMACTLKDYYIEKDMLHKLKPQKMHSFLMSLGSDPSKSSSNNASFKDIYKDIDPEITFSKSITAEVMAHFYYEDGREVGIHYPEKPVDIDPDSASQNEDRFTNSSYLYTGPKREDLETICDRKRKRGESDKSLGVCLLITHHNKIPSLIRALSFDKPIVNSVYTTTDVLKRLKKALKKTTYLKGTLWEL